MRHLQLIIEFFSLGILWIIKEAIPLAVPRYPRGDPTGTGTS